jgi:hypothetical protein
MAIDLDKVKAAAEALGKLNKVEMDFLKAYLVMAGKSNIATEFAGTAEPDSHKRGPDPRGRYKCRYCEKVLPTKRGRGIHEKMHDKQTSPE